MDDAVRPTLAIDEALIDLEAVGHLLGFVLHDGEPEPGDLVAVVADEFARLAGKAARPSASVAAGASRKNALIRSCSEALRKSNSGFGDWSRRPELRIRLAFAVEPVRDPAPERRLSREPLCLRRRIVVRRERLSFRGCDLERHLAGEDAADLLAGDVAKLRWRATCDREAVEDVVMGVARDLRDRTDSVPSALTTFQPYSIRNPETGSAIMSRVKLAPVLVPDGGRSRRSETTR